MPLLGTQRERCGYFSIFVRYLSALSQAPLRPWTRRSFDPCTLSALPPGFSTRCISRSAPRGPVGDPIAMSDILDLCMAASAGGLDWKGTPKWAVAGVSEKLIARLARRLQIPITLSEIFNKIFMG